MAITVEATYENGVLKPAQSLPHPLRTGAASESIGGQQSTPVRAGKARFNGTPGKDDESPIQKIRQ